MEPNTDHEELHARLKSTEIVVKWIMAILTALVIAGLFILRMRFDVDAHKATIEEHTGSIKVLEKNDTINAQKIDGILQTVSRIDRKLDK